jgi:hypothetical protein
MRRSELGACATLTKELEIEDAQQFRNFVFFSRFRYSLLLWSHKTDFSSYFSIKSIVWSFDHSFLLLLEEAIFKNCQTTLTQFETRW